MCVKLKNESYVAAGKKIIEIFALLNWQITNGKIYYNSFSGPKKRKKLAAMVLFKVVIIMFINHLKEVVFNELIFL